MACPLFRRHAARILIVMMAKEQLEDNIIMIMIVTVTVQQGVGCYRGVGFLC